MDVAAEPCFASGEGPTLEAHPGRTTHLGPLQIWRALPVRDRRLIGAWCFLDRYGPISFTGEKPMDVAPHPHIGIQTVSWLLEGEVLHRDSLGFEAMARPGTVNVMTSGRGIAHSEETPVANIGRLNGVQLWVALPDAHRSDAPAFHHVPEVPREEWSGGFAETFSAHAYSPLVGSDVRVHEHSTLELPLEPRFEHGLFILDGDVSLEGQPLEVNTLYYLGTGRACAALRSEGGGRLLLLGGEPFPETVLMWWNFAARRPEEIAAARQQWEEGDAFGKVRGYAGPRLHAPELTRIARPNPAS
jgi:redox-sensitive bicupin YhaK (pirin superfamily)